MDKLKKLFGITPLEAEEDNQNTSTIPEFNGKTDEEQQKKIVSMFREVFNTEHGKIVLGIILEDLYYFNTCGDDEARALNNYAKVLISQRLGFNDNKEKIDHLFDGL